MPQKKMNLETPLMSEMCFLRLGLQILLYRDESFGRFSFLNPSDHGTKS